MEIMVLMRPCTYSYNLYLRMETHCCFLLKSQRNSCNGLDRSKRKATMHYSYIILFKKGHFSKKKTLQYIQKNGIPATPVPHLAF